MKSYSYLKITVCALGCGNSAFDAILMKIATICDPKILQRVQYLARNTSKILTI